MPVYILSPYISSGAPEALHQLCHHLYTLGIDSYIVYIDKKNETGYPILYKEQYPNLQESKTIEDGSIVIFFEIMKYTFIEKLYSVKNCTYMLWWLSINNAIMYQTIDTNLENPSIVHLFHGEFIKQYVSPLFTQKQTWYYLHDYIDTRLFREEDVSKEDIVAYNPQKDCISSSLLIPRGYRTLPLVDLERFYFIHTLQKCKIYLDLGAHNGRDRIPREAALLGCVVITNRFGSAGFPEDIGIPEECKVRNEREVLERIDHVCKHYDEYYTAQKEYREGLIMDKNRFEDQIRHIILDYLVPKDFLPRILQEKKRFPEVLHYKSSIIDKKLQLFIHTLVSSKSMSTITEMGGDTRMFTDLLLHECILQNATNKRYLCVQPKTFCELEIYKHIFSEGEIVCRQLCQDYLVEIPPTDLLFLNTWHNYGQLKRELQKHHSSVHKYMVLTNTLLDGEYGESVRLGTDIVTESQLTGYSIEEITQGVRKAIDEFLQENPIWKKMHDVSDHHGIVVLEKQI